MGHGIYNGLTMLSNEGSQKVFYYDF